MREREREARRHRYSRLVISITIATATAGLTASPAEAWPESMPPAIEDALEQVGGLIPSDPLATSACGYRTAQAYFYGNVIPLINNVGDLLGPNGPLASFKVRLDFCWTKTIDTTYITSASATPSGRGGPGVAYVGATRHYLDTDGACAEVSYTGHFEDTSNNVSVWDPTLTVEGCAA